MWLWVCICVCVYVCECICLCVYECMFVFICLRVSMGMCVFESVYMYVCFCVCLSVCVFVCFMYMCTCKLDINCQLSIKRWNILGIKDHGIRRFISTISDLVKLYKIKIKIQISMNSQSIHTEYMHHILEHQFFKELTMEGEDFFPY